MALPGESLCDVILRTCCSQTFSFCRVGDCAKSSGERVNLFGISSIRSAIVARPLERSPQDCYHSIGDFGFGFSRHSHPLWSVKAKT